MGNVLSVLGRIHPKVAKFKPLILNWQGSRGQIEQFNSKCSVFRGFGGHVTGKLSPNFKSSGELMFMVSHSRVRYYINRDGTLTMEWQTTGFNPDLRGQPYTNFVSAPFRDNVDRSVIQQNDQASLQRLVIRAKEYKLSEKIRFAFVSNPNERIREFGWGEGKRDSRYAGLYETATCQTVKGYVNSTPGMEFMRDTINEVDEFLTINAAYLSTEEGKRDFALLREFYRNHPYETAGAIAAFVDTVARH
jgi:hypothetical protein